ncbi:MAG TPA: SLBB domain-containing protein [Gemmatimonadales bacterium]|nr:SLBB domain-containing protein [Gemmatimonadales bacterium]
MISFPRCSVRASLVAAALLACSAPLAAQIPAGMTPEQIARLLREQPALGELLRQRLEESGFTADQVRARLRAAGYSSDLLDPYLGGEAGAPAPSTEMLQAVSILGIWSATSRDSILAAADTTRLRMMRDSIRLDSLRRAEAAAPGKPELRLFGLDQLRQPTTQFQPLVSGPVDDQYRLGPGDILVLILTGETELAHTLEVTREGFIIIPQVGQVFVNGVTLGEVRELLYGRLGRVYSGVTRGANPRTRLQLSVARVRVQGVRVTGEVERPGTYYLAATGGVLTALYEAGGIKSRGSFRRVEVRRGRDLVGTVDVYDYLLHGIVPTDILLAPGDVVFVPVQGPRVAMVGEVMRPAAYELKPGEGLRALLQVAGGLTPRAAVGRATISRILPAASRPDPGTTQTVLTVELARVLDSTAPDVPLEAGDSVTVFGITGGRRHAVSIQGSVWQPGTYRVEAGMRFSDLVTIAGGLRPETYDGRVQILRTLPDSTRQLLGFTLSGPEAEDPLLRERDSVTVFTRTEFRPQRYVSVLGAVHRPGVVAFADSMTLRDAILLAGGLRDDAYLVEAEVSRPRPTVGTGDSLALVIRVPLDSSYVFDASSYFVRQVGARRSPEVALEPYDNIFVRQQPNWEVQRNVVVTGEVRFPGRYTILHKEERLTDLIRRAGGLTVQAYPNGVQFFRAEGDAGRIGIDLPGAIRDPDHKDNLVLVVGDSVNIPPFIPTVRVEGAVNSPSSVTYVRGRDTGYYITAAGGYTRQADKKRTWVRQPNGLIQSRSRDPEPGATVFVPTRERGSAATWIPILATLASILASTASVVIAVAR